jgi:outer membrane lipoprotein-sorting protein
VKTKRFFRSVFCASLAVNLSAIISSGASDGVHFQPPMISTSEIQQQRLHAVFAQMNPAADKRAAETAARAFLEHIRGTSPIAAEKLVSGRMDDEELEARFGVFLKDRPELSTHGKRGAETGSSRARVAELLKAETGIATSEAERLALADKFLFRLAQRSGMASESLRDGRMTDEELESRVAVFVADLKAEAMAAKTDPTAAAMEALIDSYLSANFGRDGERINEVSYRGTIEEGGVKREFTIFRKRPDKLRMHFVEEGLVLSVIGYDGKTGWRQAPGRPAELISPRDAAVLRTTARFDPPLVGYRERGAVVSRDSAVKTGEIVLRVRETDGTENFITIEEATMTEVANRSQTSTGGVEESRYRDYRKSGVLNVAYLQERWVDGTLRSTTRIEQVRVDPGILDAFFAPPVNESLGYMDYMGALIVIKNRATAQTAKSANSDKP